MVKAEDLQVSIAEGYLKLGMYFDNLIRKGNVEDEKALEMCQKIHELEKELFVLKKQEKEVAKELCPSCSKEVEQLSKFCNSCGFNIEEYRNRETVTCDLCNNELEGNSKFCSVCGSKVA